MRIYLQNRLQIITKKVAQNLAKIYYKMSHSIFFKRQKSNKLEQYFMGDCTAAAMRTLAQLAAGRASLTIANRLFVDKTSADYLLVLNKQIRQMNSIDRIVIYIIHNVVI